MRNKTYLKTEFCVIGGGLAGICAAVAAARHGVKVVLIHDRPVLGGNASSEIRMWVRGASERNPEYREGGLIEEIAMDNIYFNPSMDYPMWDAVLYNKVISEPNIELLLNTSVFYAETKNEKIKSVSAWQLTTYTEIEIQADYFCDSSGDSILGEFTGAKYRVGREIADEYDESLAGASADNKTMGNSVILQARQTDKVVKFTPPPFAKKFNKDSFPYRLNTEKKDGFVSENFWWLELGDEDNTIRDAEKIRAELIPIAYGVWDFIKNSGTYDSEKWDLDWLGFLPGKRENRRYIGDYILCQSDLQDGRIFDDEIAYGGWTIDEHNPKGMKTSESPFLHHVVVPPYSIPYRCIYSVNIKNLYFAGRNISATHIANSSARVMATCAALGQAVGSGVYLCVKYEKTPRDLKEHIYELQQILRDDDCYLLGTKRSLSESIKGADHNLSQNNFTSLLSGIERNFTDEKYCIEIKKGENIRFEFEETICKCIRLVFDNDIAREYVYNREVFNHDEYTMRQFPQRHNIAKDLKPAALAPSLVKEFIIRIKCGNKWIEHYNEEKNYQRLRKISVERKISGIEFVGFETYGEQNIRLFSIDILKD